MIQTFNIVHLNVVLKQFFVIFVQAHIRPRDLRLKLIDRIIHRTLFKVVYSQTIASMNYESESISVGLHRTV